MEKLGHHGLAEMNTVLRRPGQQKYKHYSMGMLFSITPNQQHF